MPFNPENSLKENLMNDSLKRNYIMPQPKEAMNHCLKNGKKKSLRPNEKKSGVHHAMKTLRERESLLNLTKDLEV